MNYDLELERVKKEIEASCAKTVLVQLPDGLRPKAKEIVDFLQSTGASIDIWLGSCFGACDVPSVEYDLLVQWGHSEW